LKESISISLTIAVINTILLFSIKPCQFQRNSTEKLNSRFKLDFQQIARGNGAAFLFVANGAEDLLLTTDVASHHSYEIGG